MASARRHAERYLDLDYEADQRLREQTYAKLQRETATITLLSEEQRRRIREERDLLDLLARAKQVHDERTSEGFGSETGRRLP